MWQLEHVVCCFVVFQWLPMLLLETFRVLLLSIWAILTTLY